MKRLFLGFLMALLAACSPTPKEAEKVKALTTHMRTWGLGRYSIDLPDSWTLEDSELNLYYNYASPDDGEKVTVQIIAEQVTWPQFQEALKSRSERIKSITNYETHGPMLVAQWTPEIVSDGLVRRAGPPLFMAQCSIKRIGIHVR